jgi:hypothetical protein
MLARRLFNIFLSAMFLSTANASLECWINYDTHVPVSGNTFLVPVKSEGPLYGAEVCLHYLYGADQHFYGGGSRDFAKYIVDNPNYRNLYVCDTAYCNNNSIIITTRVNSDTVDVSRVYMISGLVAGGIVIAVIMAATATVARWKKRAKVVPIESHV